VEKVRHSNSDHILDRFMSPRVAVNGDYIHVAYHDRIDRSLKYWWNKAGYAVSNANINSESSTSTIPIDSGSVTVYARRWINLDGGYNSYDNTRNRVRAQSSRTADSNGDGATPAGSTKNAAGEFNAIDVNSDGYPVIAYYDMKNQQLKIACAGKAIPLAGDDWDVQTVSSTLTGTPAGQYVSMRIDRGATPNRIHIAFFRSGTGELAYLRGTRNGNAYDFDSDSCVAVDSTGTTGKWADISLDRAGNPWISYQDISRAGTYDTAKAAYLPDAGADYKDPDNWETMHVPSRYRVEDARLNIENPLDGADNGWDAAVGCQSDYFRITYFFND
jgi:hypothetical protein